jgi:hypothetical protein
MLSKDLLIQGSTQGPDLPATASPPPQKPASAPPALYGLCKAVHLKFWESHMEGFLFKALQRDAGVAGLGSCKDAVKAIALQAVLPSGQQQALAVGNLESPLLSGCLLCARGRPHPH